MNIRWRRAAAGVAAIAVLLVILSAYGRPEFVVLLDGLLFMCGW